jgi:uncharacterized membrane protein
MVPGTSPRSGQIRTALIASLGLNLFFVGWLVGGMFGPGRGGYGPPPLPLPPLHLMAERLRGSLSDEGMAKIEALIQELDSRFARRISATEQARSRIKSQLAAEPFNADAFADALAAMHVDGEKDRAMIDRRIAEVFAALSPQDRRKVSDVTLTFPPPGRGPGPGPR